jgi:hypothetical protein
VIDCSLPSAEVWHTELLEGLLAETATKGRLAGATDLLVRRFSAEPTADRAKVVAQLDSPAAAAVLEAAAATKRLARACVKALERSPAPGAVEALERLTAPGHPAQAAAKDALTRRRKAGR